MTAQHKPDFSGEWKLNIQASTLSPIVEVGVRSGTLHIEHIEPTIMVHLKIVIDGIVPIIDSLKARAG
jgi:hypothetical protein